MSGDHLYNFNHAVKMEVHDCPSCGMPYAAPAYFFERVQNGEEKSQWYCPRGHSIVFRENKVDTLKKQLEAANRSTEFERRLRERVQGERDHAKAQARGFKGALTKTKNRISKGVCPCCNRTFENLARHMHNQHPEYVGEGAGE